MSRDTCLGLFFGLLALIAILCLVILRYMDSRPDAAVASSEVEAAVDGKPETLTRDATTEDPKLSEEVRLLLDSLACGTVWQRVAAAVTLGSTAEAADYPEVLAALKRATRDESIDVRTDAAVALVHLVVGEDYGAALGRMLCEGTWKDLILYRHLASLAEDQPLYAVYLLGALNSPVPAVQSEMRVRVSILPPEAAEALWRVAVDGEDRGQQYAAMYALVLMEDTALPTLSTALDGPDRRLAVRMLEDIAGDDELRTAEEWKVWVHNRLKDPEEDPSGRDRSNLRLVTYRRRSR